MRVHSYHRPVCSICGHSMHTRQRKVGSRYAIRLAKPAICNYCIESMATTMEEMEFNEDFNQGIFETSGVEEKNQEVAIRLEDVMNTVKSHIKGQDKAIETVATTLLKNQLVQDNGLKSNIILMGESGNGKTAMIKLIAKELAVPYVIEDATRFSKAGYVGANVESMLQNLYNRADRDKAKAERGILIIDEGDKKRTLHGNDEDVSGDAVLFSLLKIIEGAKIPIENGYQEVSYIFDTSKLSIVFIGAFPEIEKIREKRLKGKTRIGFTNNSLLAEEKQNEYISDDFIEFGIPKEFVGRFDVIEEINRLTIKDFLSIIETSESSVLRLYKKFLKTKDITLIIEEGTIDAIAKKAYTFNTGARAIKLSIQRMFMEIIKEVLMKRRTYKKCIINANTVTDNKDYILD